MPRNLNEVWKLYAKFCVICHAFIHNVYCYSFIVRILDGPIWYIGSEIGCQN